MQSTQPAGSCADGRRRRRRLLELKQEWERGRRGEGEARNSNPPHLPLSQPSPFSSLRRAHRELIKADLFHWRFFQHTVYDLLDPGAELCEGRLGQFFARGLANSYERFVAQTIFVGFE